MGKRNQYSFSKRQRELKKKKQEEKRARKHGRQNPAEPAEPDLRGEPAETPSPAESDAGPAPDTD